MVGKNKTESGWTADQRAGQQRLNDQLNANRSAPREGREPAGKEKRSGWGS
ncbi:MULTISPECIES: hypothetical protein [unclassified Streptomyces]|uniref:hypothetical protein n=1 Tax=unclassified Streptomyces TaxID=2593676 RepID=UPI0023664A90|nr:MULTISPECIES: hypothetical protein [unclassified Streptomyces]MDF3141500.1 hypothetical protein [Streptomyces sp. T21Q-yed]WDF45019.1 hypothetical protein PBV52_50870 [Streptomyces sp. T12]